MLAPDVIQSAEKRIGETISGKWRLDRVIGVGGMAAVYEATHRNRNRVAIKLLHRPLSIDEGTRQRFLREGYVANTIRHQGAVQILDDDVTEEGDAFLVMELLQGESVDERMVRKGGALEPHEALSIADQLLDVLGAAHDQRVVHRDIKPDNIFLTNDGKIKVLDFGIARLHQGDVGMTKVGSFMGTPAFVAPEQARGRWDEVDHRTDLFSVGATLFTCLTGTHVHEAETSSEQLALAISSSARSLASLLPSAPGDLVDLVDTSLAYDKEERFQSARAMRAAVERVMAGLPEHSSSPRLRSAPPVGGVTIGAPGNTTIDSHSDNLIPSNYPPPHIIKRVGIGAGAALLLGLLLYIATREEQSTAVDDGLAAVEVAPGSAEADPAGDAGMGEEESDSAGEESQADSDLAGESARSTAEEPPSPTPDPSAESQDSPSQKNDDKALVPAEEAAPKKAASSQRKTSIAGANQASKAPSPAPAPTDTLSDEENFQGRF